MCICLIKLYIVGINKCLSEAPKAIDFVVVVVLLLLLLVDVVANDDIVALLVVTGHILFSCGQ